MKKLLFVLGTRPEVIKLAPLILESKKRGYVVKVCHTGQHKELSNNLLHKVFNIKEDFNLNLMKDNQTLFDLTSGIKSFETEIFSKYVPDFVIIQGDTTTALIGALAAFYKKIKVIHIEAGLRSNNKYSPFPEEMNRVLIDRLTDLYCVPTKQAQDNLRKEGITRNIYISGNTVIDAMLKVMSNFRKTENSYKIFFHKLEFNKKLILFTGHRRENFGEDFKNILNNLIKIANTLDVDIVYPIHLNPNIKNVAQEMLKDIPNIYLYPPLEYNYFIYLLNKCHLVITDSGGIQEEAAYLGKPMLVTRTITERNEGVKEGISKLVNIKTDDLFIQTEKLITDDTYYKQIAKPTNVYGKGNSSIKILKELGRFI